jgi:hypothetical protein
MYSTLSNSSPTRDEEHRRRGEGVLQMTFCSYGNWGAQASKRLLDDLFLPFALSSGMDANDRLILTSRRLYL